MLAMELQSGNAEDSTSSTALLRRSTARRNAIRRIQQIPADKSYSKSRRFLKKAHKAGLYVAFDPAGPQPGPRAVIGGHPIVDGAAYCPCLPESLCNLDPALSAFNNTKPAPYQQPPRHTPAVPPSTPRTSKPRRQSPSDLSGTHRPGSVLPTSAGGVRRDRSGQSAHPPDLRHP